MIMDKVFSYIHNNGNNSSREVSGVQEYGDNIGRDRDKYIPYIWQQQIHRVLNLLDSQDNIGSIIKVIG